MSMRHLLAPAVLATTALTVLAPMPAHAEPDPSVVVEEDFEDLAGCSDLLCAILGGPTSGGIPEPLSSDRPGPFKDIPEGVTISGTDGGLVFGRPSTFARPASPTAVNPPGGQAGGVRIDIARDDVTSARLSVQMVEFSFTEEPQQPGTIVVTALDDEGATIDEAAVAADEADDPVTVSAPDGRVIATIVVDGVDGSETLHEFALLGTGAPAPSPDTGSGGDPVGDLLCGLLGCR